MTNSDLPVSRRNAAASSLGGFSKAVYAIHIAPREGHLNFFMRKAFNVLLKFSWEEWSRLPEGEQQYWLDEMRKAAQPTTGFQAVPAFRFTQAASAILREMKYARNNAAALRKAIKQLTTCSVEWNLMGDDGFEVNRVTSLVAQADFHKGGNISWTFTSGLFEVLVNPAVYGRIDINLQNELTNYAALALYENTIRYIGIGTTGWKSVHMWRQLLSVDGRPTEEVYSEWKRRVLKRAITELQHAHSSRIHLELEERRDPRGKAEALRFKITAVAQKQLPTSMPITPDGKLIERLRTIGMNEAEIQELFRDHDLSRVEGNLIYMEKQQERGAEIRSLKKYLLKAIEEDYCNRPASKAKKETATHQVTEQAQKAKELREAFAEFQSKRFRENFLALPVDVQLRKFTEFQEMGLVSQPDALAALTKHGLKVLAASGIPARSAAGSFLTWLRGQQPPLLQSDEETDILVFAGMRNRLS